LSLTILADENIPAVEHYLGAVARVLRVNGRTLNRAQLQGVDVLLVRSTTRVNEALLAGSEVRFVGTATSGFDHIDRDYLARARIAFARASGSNANSVVEYVLAAIAATGNTLECLLDGGVVGIVGYGVIGKSVAARLDRLGICYRVYDPWLDQESITHATDLDGVLSCDVITLHAELTKEQPWPSFHLLGTAELARVRKDALLINASRGAVIDNTALLALLAAGTGPGTVLDVWEGEPDINPALLDQVALGTAHIAGYSLDGKLQATRMLSEAVRAHMQLPALPDETVAGDVSAVTVPDGLSGAGLIRYLVQSRYDIALDNDLLRQAVAGEQKLSPPGAAFDLLRKSYRSRRELAGSRVQGNLHLPEQLALVRALDCVPPSAGNPW
jgi:erythronate-4-phosphate dehydrogenase